MAEFADIFNQFPNATVSVAVGGSPNYDGGRVRIEGNRDGYRLLASVLSAMADGVGAADHPASKHGWHIAFSPDDLGWLKMDDSILVLDCSP